MVTFFAKVCKKSMLKSCLLSSLIIMKRFSFFLVIFTRRKNCKNEAKISNLANIGNCKNEAKISNLANIGKNTIQNLKVDIVIICQINKY